MQWKTEHVPMVYSDLLVSSTTLMETPKVVIRLQISASTLHYTEKVYRDGIYSYFVSR
jgi:hypothetical protein